MKRFLDDDFMLYNECGKNLYHTYAKNLPIYDYHCHLSVKDIYENRVFSNIVDLWLDEDVDGKCFGDHYKWRLMRANGVDEEYITGSVSKEEKFVKWVESVSRAIGNPLYHWTHLELKKYFGIDEPLKVSNASKIYKVMNEKLKDLSARKIIEMSNVDVICTTDDPCSDLKYHKLLKEDATFKTKVYPSFRPDNFINIYKASFKNAILELEKVVGFKIDSLEDLKNAISLRIKYFNEVGCRVSDQAYEKLLFVEASETQVDSIFKKGLNGEALSDEEVAKYIGYITVFLGKEYHKYNWVQQYHLKATRNNNTPMFNKLGVDAGYDAIGDSLLEYSLKNILDSLEKENSLPKTIIYSLNPNDYEVICALGFSFIKGKAPSKIQLGAAWWFNDHKDGMERQLTTFANYGMLYHFVGMLTDSRSLLSYARHDYFRRILCNKIGEFVEKGEFPNDEELLKEIVENISYYNAKKYFDEDR